MRNKKRLTQKDKRGLESRGKLHIRGCSLGSNWRSVKQETQTWILTNENLRLGPSHSPPHVGAAGF